MKERTKLILGGIWVSLLTIVSVWLLSLFQDMPHYSVVVLVWAFAWLGGLQFSSWIDWAKDYRKRSKEKEE